MAVDKNKLIAEATRYVQKGQWDKAIKAYERILAEDPRDVRVLLKIGELQQKKDDIGAAATTMHTVAEAYTEQGFFLKAVAVYKQIARLTPEDVRVNEKLAGLYEQLGIMSDAMAQHQIVAAAAERSGDDDRLAAVLRRMTELDPENPAPGAKLGELLARQGDTKGALELLHRAAESLRKANRMDEYIRVAERIVALEPGDVLLCRELAHLYLARGDTRRALAKLQHCFKANPDDVDTLNLLGQAFRELGQVSKTVAVYKELARIHGDHGRPDEARLAWKRVLEFAPEDPDALDALESRTPEPAGPEADAAAADETGEAGFEVPAAPPPAARPVPRVPAPEPAAPPEPAPPSLGPEAIPKLITETDVYLKYGLRGKAAEHLEAVFAIDPDHLDALERARDLAVASNDAARAVELGARFVRSAIRRGESARAREGLDRLSAIAPGHDVLAALREEIVAGPPAAEPSPAAVPGAAPEEQEPVELGELLVEVEPEEEGPADPDGAGESGIALAGTAASRGADVDLSDDLAEIDFYVEHGLFDEARDALAGLRALYPDDAALVEREKQLEQAVAAATESTPPAAPPPSPAAPPPVAELHYSVQDALRQFRRSVQQQVRPEDADTHYDLGIACKEMGLLDDALRELEAALAARPGRKEIDCLTMIGLCRLQKGDVAGAVAAYRAALASEHLTPDAARALRYELAMAYRARGDHQAALWYLNQVLREDPSFRDARGLAAVLGAGEGRPPPDDPEVAGAPVAASS